MNLKAATVIGLMILITILHYGGSGADMGLHLLHRELYFIPILLASLWFGLKIGLFVSLLISAIFLPPLLFASGHGESLFTIISQIIMFNLVAALVGILSDRRNKAREKAFTAEKQALVGRAVSAIGYELKDIAEAMNRLFEQSKGFGDSEANRNYHEEMRRMNRLLDSLTRFVPQSNATSLYVDVNDLAAKSVAQLHDLAAQSGVTLTTKLGDSGCHTRAVSLEFGALLTSIVKNAIEASPTGASITVAGKRESDCCVIEVEDHGHGVAPEHKEKIFTPFFTTKSDGYGLTLALAKKEITAIGGEITMESEPGKGTLFRIRLPKETNEAPRIESLMR